MEVKVHWKVVEDELDEQWNFNSGLYAYLTPKHDEILYIGKVDGCTVRQRWNATDKMKFWRDLERERRVYRHAVLFGGISLQLGSRLTGQLLSDVESLLIHQVSPWGNIQSRKARIIRPGMRVVCTGYWPLSTRTFTDAIALSRLR